MIYDFRTPAGPACALCHTAEAGNFCRFCGVSKAEALAKSKTVRAEHEYPEDLSDAHDGPFNHNLIR